MEILKKIWDNVGYLDRESNFFSLSIILDIENFLRIKDMSIKEGIEFIESISFSKSVYSTYFNENFITIDDYEDFLKSKANDNDFSFYDFQKYEETRENISVLIDGEYVEYVDYFDIEFKIESLENKLNNTLLELKEAQEYIDNFNDFIYEMEDKNIDTIEKLAIEIVKNESINISDFFLVNREQGFDEELNELYSIYKEYKKKIEFKENLEKTLSVKQDKKTTFKI